MNLNTFFQVCIYMTVCMILFTLSVNFVSALGVFPTGDVEAGVNVGDSTNETFMEFTKSTEDPSGLSMTSIWTIVLTGAGIGTLVIAWITKSTVILGVYVFSVIFWVSYGNALSILGLGNYIPLDFLAIGTGGMIFIWVGAIAGMLSGSG